MFELSTTNFILAFIAAFILGVSKAGLKGIAIVIMTIMALVFGSKASTGIVMPLLLVGDLFAIIYYRKHVQKKHLLKLIPWMLLGVLIGVFVGKDIPEDLFKKGMAGIILISVIIMFWWDYRKSNAVPTHFSFGISMGLSAGFATMIGNLAGAFTNLYFLAMRLPKNSFIGTAAWLYFFVNWFKVPFHVFSWETINVESLKISLFLIPAEIVGLLIGVRIVKRIRDKHYRIFILALTAIGAIVLFFR
jgi:uncharacterized membrane protein YfcA